MNTSGPQGAILNEMSVLWIPLHIPISTECQVTHNVRDEIAYYVAYVPRFTPISSFLLIDKSVTKISDVFQDLLLQRFYSGRTHSLHIDSALERMLCEVGSSHGHVNAIEEVLEGAVGVRLPHIGPDSVDVSQCCARVDGDAVGAKADEFSWRSYLVN